MIKGFFSIILSLALPFAAAPATAAPLTLPSYCERVLNLPLRAHSYVLKNALSLKGKEKSKALMDYAAPRPKNAFDKAFVLADWAMAMWIGSGLIEGFSDEPSKLILATVLVAPSLWLADFVGQGFHKWLDSYASETSKIWGVAAQEFRKHHEAPSNLNNVPYLSHVSAFGKLMAPMFIGASLVQWDPAVGTSVWVMLMSLLHTTEFHKQAHRNQPNVFFKYLQKFGLAIGHDQHMKHHAPPFDTEYSVYNGWSEPLTRKFKLWSRLDRLWWKALKKLPRNWIQDPRAMPKDVLEGFYADVKAIPEELWIYSDIYPNRVSPDVQKLLDTAREQLRVEYIEARRQLFLEGAKTDPERFERLWQQEQMNSPWVYGENEPFLPLNR